MLFVPVTPVADRTVAVAPSFLDFDPERQEYLRAKQRFDLDSRALADAFELPAVLSDYYALV